MTTPHILNFTIYGERCSGTTFLEEAITSNFNLPVMWYYDWKHFFGSYDFDADKKESEANGTGAPADNTLFIGIVRNPVRWLHSFSKRKQNLPASNQTLGNFFQHEFYSVNENDEVIAEDVHLTTKERFKNIFELRKVKNDFLINVMPTKVQNYILITYEDLLYKYDETLNAIQHLFGLTPLYSEYVKIPNHTIDQTPFAGEREVDFAPSIIQYIWENVDKQQERLIGYECAPVFANVNVGNNTPASKSQPQVQRQPIQPPKSLSIALPTAKAHPISAPILNKPLQPELKLETIKKAPPVSLSGILQNTTMRQVQAHTPKPNAPTFGIGLGKRMNNGRIA